MKDSAQHNNTAARRIAIIGTGPLSLLKSLQLVKADPGCYVTLFDSAQVAGGAWYSDQSPEGFEIECGCHIWSYVPVSYRFIERELGVKLYPVKPNPVFVGSAVRVPYSLKNTIDTYKAFFKTLVLFRWKQLKNFRHDPNMNFRIFGKRNRYPKSGSPELIHALLKKVHAEKNISINLNSQILDFQIGQNKATLLAGSEQLEFDKLYLTYVSRVGKIWVDNVQLDIKFRRVDYIHFLIRTNKPILKKISYWRLIADPVIHRITDISGQTGHKENLFLVGIKDKAYYAYNSDEEKLMAHCRSVFEKYKLIDPTFDFEKIKTHIFPTHYMDENLLRELKKREPVVSLMHTTDLMHGFYFLLEGN